MSRFGGWTGDLNSWRTFDALHLHTDGELTKLREVVERELRFREYPAMVEKHALVMNEIRRREQEAAGVSPSQLRRRAVVALERIAAAIESGNYDRADVARELFSIRESLQMSSESTDSIAQALSDIRDKLTEDW